MPQAGVRREGWARQRHAQHGDGRRPRQCTANVAAYARRWPATSRAPTNRATTTPPPAVRPMTNAFTI
ncbi:MAG: hypothetical protein ACLR3C_03590 [Eggerthella lenta]